jgi:hypothetical protein
MLTAGEFRRRNRDLVATLQKVAKVQFVNDGDS